MNMKTYLEIRESVQRIKNRMIESGLVAESSKSEENYQNHIDDLKDRLAEIRKQKTRGFITKDEAKEKEASVMERLESLEKKIKDSLNSD